MTTEQQREACAELARAMYPTAVIEPSSSGDGVDVRVYDKPNETRSWYGFNPFNSPEASRELVLWLAKQDDDDIHSFICFTLEIVSGDCALGWEHLKSTGIKNEVIMKLLTAPLPAIAEAACKALGIEVSE